MSPDDDVMISQLFEKWQLSSLEFGWNQKLIVGSGYARLAKLFMLSALPHGHFNPITSVLLSKSFNTPVQQFITWVPIVHLLTMHHTNTSSNHWICFLTLKHDNAHHWIVLFFMSYSPLFIQLGRFQLTTYWTWLLNGMECNIYMLKFLDNSVQSPHNHTFGIQLLEI